MFARIVDAISFFLALRDAALVARRRRPEDVRDFLLHV